MKVRFKLAGCNPYSISNTAYYPNGRNSITIIEDLPDTVKTKIMQGYSLIDISLVKEDPYQSEYGLFSNLSNR